MAARGVRGPTAHYARGERHAAVQLGMGEGKTRSQYVFRPGGHRPHGRGREALVPGDARARRSVIMSVSARCRNSLSTSSRLAQWIARLFGADHGSRK